jgi:multidrug efflux pump
VNFSEFFIRRPVLSIVVSLLILLIGLEGFANMAIRQYPQVEESIINVQTSYPGASAETMQGFITAPIARAVSSTENVDYVTSSSSQGSSQVQVHMRLGANANDALTEVISETQQVRRLLPTDAEDPVITKQIGRNVALVFLGFYSETMSSPQINEYLNRVVQPRLATIQGVGDANVFGAQNFSMRVWLDPILMASRGVTATDVMSAIQRANFISAPGSTKNEYVTYTVNAQTTLKSPAAFGALPIRGSGDSVVRLRDVAKVELGPANTDVSVLYNGHKGVLISINPTPEANPLDVAKRVKAAMPSIIKDLPPGMHGNIIFDNSLFINSSINEVFKTIFEAVAIVIMVIFLFLGSVRAVFIPIVTIPLSLIGVCFILYFFGFSINLLTLLAMVLAIGLVVDDAIVVVENVHRHIEMGERPLDAAIKGMRELFVAVIAMTITLAAVFTPIAFMGGLTGLLFREFAVALAGAVIISGFIAVTLSPMMASRLLRPHDEAEAESGLTGKLDRLFERIASSYGGMLDKALQARAIIVVAFVAVLGTTVFLFLNTNHELAPQEDQGALISRLQGPTYATSQYMRRYVDQLDKLVGKVPEAQSAFSVVGEGGGNGALAIWTFKPWSQRKRSSSQIQRQLQASLSKVTGAQGFVFSPPLLPGAGNGSGIQFVLRSVSSPEQVYDVAERIKNAAMASGKFMIVQDSMSYDQPRANITIDRAKAAALDTPTSDIGTTLSIFLNNARVSRYEQDNRDYDVIAQVSDRFRRNPRDLDEFYVRSAGGTMVPLSAVTDIKTTAAPVQIEQFNQLNSATLSATPMLGVSRDDALRTLQTIADQTMPDGFFVDYSGQERTQREAGSSLVIAFGLSILIIYLVLAAQFESFRDPLIIMMAVPPCIFGAMALLNVGFGTLNIYTQVGMITLVGLITKHGILMVQFANARRDEGKPKREAISEAARVRLRPILMTTAAMVMGVMPLVLASGAGAAARSAIGIVIASGIAIGTLFTLFVVPTFYTFIAHSKRAAPQS